MDSQGTMIYQLYISASKIPSIYMNILLAMMLCFIEICIHIITTKLNNPQC